MPLGASTASYIFNTGAETPDFCGEHPDKLRHWLFQRNIPCVHQDTLIEILPVPQVQVQTPIRFRM